MSARGFLAGFHIGPVRVRIAYAPPHGRGRHGRPSQDGERAPDGPGAGARTHSPASSEQSPRGACHADAGAATGGHGGPPLLLLGPGGDFRAAYDPDDDGRIVRREVRP